QRVLVEEDLKAGRVPCLVATSSLELGIDMGAGDLVVQVESPKSVARGLQRIGRSRNPLDVLAQQIVAICADDEIEVAELHRLVRGAYPFADLSRPQLENVLDM